MSNKFSCQLTTGKKQQILSNANAKVHDLKAKHCLLCSSSLHVSPYFQIKFCDEENTALNY